MMEMETLRIETVKEEKPRHFKPQIGELLLEQELIIQHDLDFALEHQKYSKETLGEILVRMGALDLGDLEKTLAAQQNVMYFV
ncbi:MAG: hypothetical protein A2X56_06520 [Nitrospirae bacterium GWC2_57_13]|nr:MAG: hypothetical protein A2072_02230 [Nitrospirae bacterium GWC1_57_7]OGW29736.1 MAG: hypothetical protein A2X56_06520 [Nitrospirae bacterium GWC2_57_13]OGW40852.1 MAG: hypothetical protein A2X57_07305 [Nitrospirae bacterium GWD2_57_8]HAS54059.1 hypothetical protein [Nitrospiraceae bacterium]